MLAMDPREGAFVVLPCVVLLSWTTAVFVLLQCKNMVQPHRALATFVYLAAIAGTLAVAFSVSVLAEPQVPPVTFATLVSAAAVRTVNMGDPWQQQHGQQY